MIKNVAKIVSTVSTTNFTLLVDALLLPRTLAVRNLGHPRPPIVAALLPEISGGGGG